MPLNQFARGALPKIGMGDMVNKVNAGLCPFCGVAIDLLSFKDELSVREYHISGLCQKCQDKIFK